MANQDNLTIGGIGSDPSGAYTPIETGWDATYADGAVKWRPTSVSDVSTAVSDTGDVMQTSTKSSATTGFTINAGGDDTFQIQDIPSGATVSTTKLSIEVTVNTGTDGTGTFTLADAAITSISDGGLITFSGTGGFSDDFEGTITYDADIDEAVATAYYQPVTVVGAKELKLYHPASLNSEVTAKFQYTDDDLLSIDGTEQATWTDIGSASSSAVTKTLVPSVNADWAILDKIKAVRLVLISTDVNTDGVTDVSGAYENPSSGAYVSWADDRSAESNTGITISGIGADPS